MPIGTPVLIADNTTYASETLNTTADIPIGSTVVVTLGTNEDASASTVSDGTANTYVPVVQNTPEAGYYTSPIFVCEKTVADIPSGTAFSGYDAEATELYISTIVSVQGAMAAST
jgi:hypothetical protein